MNWNQKTDPGCHDHDCAGQIVFQNITSIIPFHNHGETNYRILSFCPSAGLISNRVKVNFVFMVPGHFLVFLSQVFEGAEFKHHVFHLVGIASDQKVTNLVQSYKLLELRDGLFFLTDT